MHITPHNSFIIAKDILSDKKRCSDKSPLEGLKIYLELSASDANASILSRDSYNQLWQTRQVEAGFLNTSGVATRVTMNASRSI